MIFDLFSNRQKRASGEVKDVFQYENLSQPLRIQIVHIIRDAMDPSDQYGDSFVAVSNYKDIYDILCREYGLFQLPQAAQSLHRSPDAHLFDYFVNKADLVKALDFVELAFKSIERVLPDLSQRVRPKMEAEGAINELNYRLKEAAFGYEYSDGQLIRVDSKFIHSEVTLPALSLLNKIHYAGACAEFLSAHEHYRHNRHKECLNDCLKSFESVMKSICDKRGWTRDPNATASALINVCLTNNLIPAFMQSQMTALRSALESGVPTVRNRLGGHGQGSQQIVVPPYITSYMLHLTATNILLLAEAEKALS